MIREEEVYRIGRLGKAHGINGELTFQFDDDVFDRTDADFLVLRIDGILVPFFIEEYRFRSDTTAIVKFEGIDTLDRAREFTNTEVYFLRALADTDDEEYTWAQLVGYTVTDEATKAVVGTIADIDDSTVNVLFCLDDGRLLPAAEKLVADIDHNSKTITMVLPAGLLEL